MTICYRCKSNSNEFVGFDVESTLVKLGWSHLDAAVFGWTRLDLTGLGWLGWIRLDSARLGTGFGWIRLGKAPDSAGFG